MCSADALSSVTPTWRVESKPIVYPFANLNGVALSPLRSPCLYLMASSPIPSTYVSGKKSPPPSLRACHAAQYGSPLNFLSTQ